MAEINLKVLDICMTYVIESTTPENRQEMKDLAEAIRATANQNVGFYQRIVQLLSRAYNKAVKLKCSSTLTFYLGQAIVFFQNKEDEARSALLSERLRVIKAC